MMGKFVATVGRPLIFFAALLIWVAYTFIPGVSEVLDQLMWAANLTVTTFTETIV